MIGYQRFTAEDGRSAEMGVRATSMVAESLPALAHRLDAQQGAFETWECQRMAKVLDNILATGGDISDEEASELKYLVQFFRQSGRTTMTQLVT
jgi:hypothetical protein